ncbi:XRE family transcriptional regulator [Comamonadaceae bacterium OH2545_COT-014]|nr:XRE family transcriptional regulator [Comamonadaceae bacterium OH2545_COT-014]
MAEVVDQALGQALRKLRTERGWSQTELALRAGMDRNYLSLIELGRNSPSVRMLLRLCQALDMSAAEVLADAERRMALLELDEGLSGPGQQNTLP